MLQTIIRKPITPNRTLKTKGMVQNDEFYTTRETVLKQLEPFWDYLNGKKIICPCDTKESEYYKILKEKGYNVSLAPSSLLLQHDMYLVDYSKYDVVITNPPFSLINSFFDLIKNTKWIILCPWLFIGNKYALKNLQDTFWSASLSTTWKNQPKKVNIRFHTNIFDAYKHTKTDRQLTGKISDFNDVKMKNWIRTGFHFQDFQCKPNEWKYLKQYAKPGVRSVSCYYLYIPNAPFIKQRIWQLKELPAFIKYLKNNANYIRDIISYANLIYKNYPNKSKN